jgi:hypothetical protein
MGPIDMEQVMQLRLPGERRRAMTRNRHLARTKQGVRALALLLPALFLGCASSGSGGSRARGPITLEEIPIFNAQEIRLLSASEALSRCGIGAGATTASGRYLYVIRKRYDR